MPLPRDTSGRIGNYFIPKAVQASLALTDLRRCSRAARSMVGDAGDARQDAAMHEVHAYDILTTAAAERRDTAAENAYATKQGARKASVAAWASPRGEPGNRKSGAKNEYTQ